ncbi:MAG: hypothetical protein ACRDOM_01750, partial [Nocardioides sp.]
MTDADWLVAARLALPDTARLTGLSRIQELGLDFGPRFPLHFVVESDLHLVIDRIFLHRTCELPPEDGAGVTAEAAFLAYCRWARFIDAIKVGDWLLHRGHVTVESIRALALQQQWRDGADEALCVLGHLDGDARSLKESETRAVLEFAGLPRPEVNPILTMEDGMVLVPDLLYAAWRTAVEYEGVQHQEDRTQYATDLDRYALMRSNGLAYVQASKERLD